MSHESCGGESLRSHGSHVTVVKSHMNQGVKCVKKRGNRCGRDSINLLGYQLPFTQKTPVKYLNVPSPEIGGLNILDCILQCHPDTPYSVHTLIT